MKARRRGLFAIFAAIAFAYAAIFFLQHFYGASSGQDGARTGPRPGPCHGRRPPAAPGQPHHGHGASPGGDARRHKPLHLPLPARCREASRPEGGSAPAQGARGVHRRRPLPDGRSEGPLRHPERRRLPQGREATACAGHPCLHAGLRDDRRHRLGWRRTRTSPSSARPPAPFPLRSAPSRGCAGAGIPSRGPGGAPLLAAQPFQSPCRQAGQGPFGAPFASAGALPCQRLRAGEPRPCDLLPLAGPQGPLPAFRQCQGGLRHRAHRACARRGHGAPEPRRRGLPGSASARPR